MTDSKPDAGLGLPTRAGGIKTEADRPFIQYTLPENMVGLRWTELGFTADDRVFKMSEITPRQQDKAAKLANGNNSVLGRELMFASLYRIGAWKPQRNRDRLTQWWEAVGSKGRRLIEAAFMKMQSVEETDVDSFLDSGVPGGSGEG